MSGSRAQPGSQLTVLQAGRAIAALLVVLFHLSTSIFANPRYWGRDPAGSLFAFGHSGVQFFFVLSGFIILYVHGRDLGMKGRFRDYALKRLVRIYPIYWLVLLVILPVFFLVPSFGTGLERNGLVILSSWSLVHLDALMPGAWAACRDEGARTILPVAWTLYHEILFYAVFAVVILAPRLGRGLMSTWLLASVVLLFVSNRPCTLEYFFSPLHLLFAMGMVACWAVQHRAVRAPGVVAAAGVALFAASAGIENWGTVAFVFDVKSLLYGLASMLLTMGTATLELDGRIRAPALSRLLGDASYSIYLIHFPLLSVMAKVFLRVDPHRVLPALVPFTMMFLLAASAGVAVHLLVEKPLTKAFRGGLGRLYGVPRQGAA